MLAALIAVGVVFPGETLDVAVWDEADRLLVTASVIERENAPALANVVVEKRR